MDTNSLDKTHQTMSKDLEFKIVGLFTALRNNDICEATIIIYSSFKYDWRHPRNGGVIFGCELTPELQEMSDAIQDYRAIMFAESYGYSLPTGMDIEAAKSRFDSLLKNYLDRNSAELHILGLVEELLTAAKAELRTADRVDSDSQDTDKLSAKIEELTKQIAELQSKLP